MVAAGFSISESLRTYPYFESIHQESLALLTRSAIRRQFSAGETIFLEGEPPSGMWFIEQGLVKIYKLSVDGREHISLILGPGDAFNEIPVIDGGPNAANAGALSEVLAWVVPTGAVQAALENDPGLILGVVSGMAERVRELVDKLGDLALYAVPTRVARYLIARHDAGQPLDDPDITRIALAAHLATTPETLSRVLKTFETAGAIRCDRQQIMITDLDLLRDIALL